MLLTIIDILVYMKAWILEKQGKVESRPLRLVDNYPTPEPGYKQVRIRIEYTGICRTDMHIAEGDLPLHKQPIVLGHQIAGKVDKVGEGARRFKVGDRVGLTWLYGSCGSCKYCLNGLENYCPNIVRTGWDVDGGYTEYVVAHEDYVVPLNDVPLKTEDLPPLMCPGVTGFLGFKMANPIPGDKIGLIGFGPTAYYLLKISKYLGMEVYVSTRSKKHKEIASENGADYIGNILVEDFPVKMDHIISAPPVGEVIEKALKNLRPGGNLVLLQIASTPITIKDYTFNLWGRNILTVYNVRRNIIPELLEYTHKINLSIEKDIFSFDELMDGMIIARKGMLEGMTAVSKVT